MSEAIEMRPLDVPDGASLRDRQMAVISQLRPGEAYAMTTSFLSEVGGDGLLDLLSDLMPPPDFPHAFVFDAHTGNIVVARLTAVRGVLDLLCQEAVVSAAFKVASEAEASPQNLT